MITIEQLLSYSRTTGLKPYQQEKNYIQTIILRSIYSTARGLIVFKGGTGLMFAFGLGRFSDGLEFTAEKSIAVEILAKKAVTDLNNLGISSTYGRSKRRFSDDTFRIRSEGLLSTTSSSVVVVRIEVSKREEVLLRPDARSLDSLYPDVPAFSYLMMQPAEILSEKVRAVLTKLQARDVFDMYFLVSQGYSTNRLMIDQKLKYYKRTFDKAEFRNRLLDIAPLWKTEMEPIVIGNLPPIDSVIEAVEKAASSWP
jgi:predicted nucleotidyltransferase component of viral defense system